MRVAIAHYLKNNFTFAIKNTKIIFSFDSHIPLKCCLIEETDIYNDFQARKATNPKQYAQLTQEVKDEIFGINHQ